MNSINFDFIEDCPEQKVILSRGKYMFEAWGASGGGINVFGKGAYAKGLINLKNESTFYIFVGGSGQNTSTTELPRGGCNGGGNGGSGTSGFSHGSGGGGATDIRLNISSLESRILIAAGGGGSSGLGNIKDEYKGGDGGDEVGGIGLACPEFNGIRYPANQTFGFALGYGEDGRSSTGCSPCGAEGSGGAGGGLYGGQSYNENGANTNTGGNGGSSYASKEFFRESYLLSGSKLFKYPNRNGFFRITPIFTVSIRKNCYQTSKNWMVIVLLILS